MANIDKRITELNLHNTLIFSDVIPIVNSGETKKTTYGALYYGIREGLLSGSLPPGLGSSGLGWARYDDTQYTTGSVFSLPILDGEQVLPNNGGNTINVHIHSTVEFYNTGSQIIQVENVNDVYVATITFKAKTGNANGTYIRLQLDNTTGTPYERVGKDLFFGKGNDEWHTFHEVFQYYADTDFVANGNEWNVQAFGNDCQIADIIYFIQRTQNHGGE